MTPYVDFDEQGLMRVGCMICNDTIGTREADKDGNLFLKHWSHLRKFSFTLSDGSYTDALLCADCLPLISSTDLQHFEDTIKFGWRMEKGHLTGVLVPGVSELVVQGAKSGKGKALNDAGSIAQLDNTSDVVASDEVLAVDLGEHFETLKVLVKGRG